MDLHYNAFISYRHHPDDIRVASEIHRALERFHIPRTLKKKAKRITRIFRDKEELPITSDLNDDIGYALENADYLIVICSVHTKESIWVQREIETFLKTHHRSKVLTVLASGEPYDVIPEILLKDKVVDPETGETRLIDVEPLSCDWRLPSRRKRMQEELPRLAAALMGCGYDELRQRQRQYRMRRLITIFSISLAASLALAAYFLHTSITIYNANLQIQANFEQSQRNQSQHLATAAQERLDSGDRLTAISLALAALPSENNPRPYVPEAEYVLSNALGVYSTSSQPVAIGSISPGTNLVIDDFWLTEDGSTLYLKDQRDVLTAWDTESFQKLGSITLFSGYMEKVLTTPGNNIAFFDTSFSQLLCCYSPQGERLWELNDCRDFSLLKDGSAMLIIQEDDTGNYHLLYLDPETGKPVRKAQNLTHPEGLEPYDFYCDSYHSNFPIVLSCWADYEQSFWIFDPTSATYFPLESAVGSPDHVTITPEGKLLVLTTSSENIVGIVERTRLTAPITGIIDCYDLSTRELLWSTETATYSYANGYFLEKIPTLDRILFIGGSQFFTLDVNTGEILSQCEALSNILAAQMGEQYVSAVLEDGYLCNFWYEEEYCYEPPCMEGGLQNAAIHNGYIGLQAGDTQVTLYREMERVTDWRYDPDAYLYVDEKDFNGTRMTFSDFDYIYLMELEQPDILWQIEKSGTDLLGFSEDGSKVMMVLENAYLVSIDQDTQDVTHQVLPSADTEVFTYVTSDYLLSGNQLLYTYLSDEDYYFCAYDFAADTPWNTLLFRESDVPDTLFTAFSSVLGTNGQYAWVWSEPGEVYEVDLTAGTARCILRDEPQTPAFALSDDGTQVALTTSEGVMVLTPGAESALTITIEEASAGRLRFYGEELLALCDNGFLYRFDSTGTLLSRIKMAVGPSFGSELFSDYYDASLLSWQFLPDGRLILDAYGYCSIVDLENNALQASLTGYITYLEDTRQFICKAENGDMVAFPHYTTAALLQLAQDQLGDYTLTGEQKAAYGIG